MYLVLLPRLLDGFYKAISNRLKHVPQRALDLAQKMSDQMRGGGESARHGNEPTRVSVELRGARSYIGTEAPVDPLLTRIRKPKGEARRLLWLQDANVNLSQAVHRGVLLEASRTSISANTRAPQHSTLGRFVLADAA